MWTSQKKNDVESFLCRNVKFLAITVQDCYDNEVDKFTH